VGSPALRLSIAEYVDVNGHRLKVLWVARRWCEIVYGAPLVLLAVLGQESTMD